MFLINLGGTQNTCFTSVDNGIKVYDFNNVVIDNKLNFNEAIANMLVRSDADVIRVFYIGLATKAIKYITINPAIADVGNTDYTLVFRVLFRNLGYKINESILSNFNISLFVDECMNLFNIRILPLISTAVRFPSSSNVEGYISNIPTVYSENDIAIMNANKNTFISAVANFNLK